MTNTTTRISTFTTTSALNHTSSTLSLIYSLILTHYVTHGGIWCRSSDKDIGWQFIPTVCLSVRQSVRPFICLNVRLSASPSVRISQYACEFCKTYTLTWGYSKASRISLYCRQQARPGQGWPTSNWFTNRHLVSSFLAEDTWWRGEGFLVVSWFIH